MEIVSTVTAATAVDLADRINAAFEAGEITVVNGEELVSPYRTPVARSWQNGTISVTVRGRTRGATRTDYIKVGKALVAR